MMKILPLLLLLVLCISNVYGGSRAAPSPRRSKEKGQTNRRNRYVYRRRLANNVKKFRNFHKAHVNIRNFEKSSGASDKININRDVEIPNNDTNPSQQYWTIELSLPWVIGIGSVIITSLICNIIYVYINCCSRRGDKYTSAKEIVDWVAEEITE